MARHNIKIKWQNRRGMVTRHNKQAIRIEFFHFINEMYRSLISIPGSRHTPPVFLITPQSLWHLRRQSIDIKAVLFEGQQIRAVIRRRVNKMKFRLIEIFCLYTFGYFTKEQMIIDTKPCFRRIFTTDVRPAKATVEAYRRHIVI